MRISDWSSDVCSSDLSPWPICHLCRSFISNDCWPNIKERAPSLRQGLMEAGCPLPYSVRNGSRCCSNLMATKARVASLAVLRSEEHTSELQSLMRISYAVFCLKKKKQNKPNTQNTQTT